MVNSQEIGEVNDDDGGNSYMVYGTIGPILFWCMIFVIGVIMIFQDSLITVTFGWIVIAVGLIGVSGTIWISINHKGYYGDMSDLK